MDPRDVKNALGLLAIVLEVSESGAGGIQVVTTHGLITTENGKGPYWLPSDRCSVPRVQDVAMPWGLNTVQRDIQKNIFDLERCRKISIQKAYRFQHPMSVEGGKGCGCEGNKCTNFCGCIKAKKKCTERCGCKGGATTNTIEELNYT
ncbi:hypothetical protein IV203_033828 [Nitzschia inconspicua]|uniref:Tesmin/TSO1-like CXC domain-containing protein n=1 Tax=Nitzschia inconspicua TaxID=303405 RepID=A0A9K3M3I4_9STRA|nr:hypothetical protein IV203_033828 [Nitzschia inconspicua]